MNDHRPIDWVNVSFLVLTPVVSVCGIAWYAWNYGVTWLEIANLAFMYMAAGMAITAGYHRLFSHRSYDASKPVKLLYLLFGAAAVQNSLVNWASDHRDHHRFVDKEEDPYNILKGGLYAHMGWIFYKDTRDQNRRFENIPDLLKDPLVVWQHRWYLPIVAVVGFALPAAIGALEGRPLGGLLWGGFLRTVLVHHSTFLINSAAHLFGTRPYSLTDTARDSWWLGVLTFGEGYHNFHHKFQADYRNGIRWWQFDLSKWLINALAWTGQAWRLKRTPEPLIVKARLEVEKKLVAERVALAPEPERLWQKLESRLEAGSKRLELAHQQYLLAKAEYSHRRDEWTADMRRQWREKLDAYQSEYKDALERWRSMMRAMNRLPQPSASGLFSLGIVLDVLKHKPW